MVIELTDEEVHERLCAAVEALGTDVGETTRGNTALEAARQMLTLLQFGLVKAMEDNASRIEGLTDPEHSPRPPLG